MTNLIKHSILEIKMDFVCPICGGELAVCDSLIKRCPLGHSFDRARAGYYNLLPSGSGGVHGDNAEMVSSRRAFLSLGFTRSSVSVL